MEEEQNPESRKNTGITRDDKGRFIPGVSGNPGGRKKDTLKEYMRNRFMSMTDEEKEEFLKQVPPEMQWRMAEGNPKQDTDITSAGQPIPILTLNPNNALHSDNSNDQITEPNQEN